MLIHTQGVLTYYRGICDSFTQTEIETLLSVERPSFFYSKYIFSLISQKKLQFKVWQVCWSIVSLIIIIAFSFKYVSSGCVGRTNSYAVYCCQFHNILQKTNIIVKDKQRTIIHKTCDFSCQIEGDSLSHFYMLKKQGLDPGPNQTSY